MTVEKLLVDSRIADSHEAELLLAHVLGAPREFIVAHPEAKVGLFDYWQFKRLIRKRKSGVPIAYLTGHKEFYGLDFVVTKDVLVPRPETEVLVESVLEHLLVTSYPLPVTLIDVGTGSGCIPISVLKTLKHATAIGHRLWRDPAGCGDGVPSEGGKNIKAIGIDISRRALKIAKKNAARHGVDITFLHGDLLQPLLDNVTMYQCSNVIITANLPYLTEQQFRGEPSIQHEPKSALVADDNGLALYEKLFEQVDSLIFSFQFSVFLLLEIDPSQSSRITTIINEHFPSATVEIKKDLAGRDRVVIVEQS